MDTKSINISFLVICYQRGLNGLVMETSFLSDAFLEQSLNNYHPESNPHGIINLGTAEIKSFLI